MLYNGAYHEAVLKPNETLTVSLTITNSEETSKTLLCYIAQYDSTDCLIELAAGDAIIVPCGETITETVSQTFSNPNTAYAKVFLWDKNNFKPISSGIKITPSAIDYYSNTYIDANTIETNRQIYGTINIDTSVSFGNVKLIEPVSGKTIAYSGGEQVISYFQNPVKYIDYEITPFVGCDEEQNISLEFNSDIEKDSVSGNLYLISPEGIAFCPHYEVIDNKIVVHSPSSGYTYNTSYKLYITDGVITNGGNSLKNNIEVLIYILAEVTDIDIPLP